MFWCNDVIDGKICNLQILTNISDITGMRYYEHISNLFFVLSICLGVCCYKIQQQLEMY